MQTSLNLSLARVLHVYGDHTRLLADTGITPLQLTKYVHLAPLHFKLTITRPDTLLVLLCKKINTPCPLSNLHTTNYHIRYATLAFKTDLQTGPLFHLASQTSKNRLLAFRNMMKKIISDLWKGQLYNAALIPAVQPLGKNQIAWDDLQCLDLFKTTQFLLNPHNQLPLLRLPTPANNYIPSQLHLSKIHTTCTPYDERYCSSCLPLQIL